MIQRSFGNAKPRYLQTNAQYGINASFQCTVNGTTGGRVIKCSWPHLARRSKRIHATGFHAILALNYSTEKLRLHQFVLLRCISPWLPITECNITNGYVSFPPSVLRRRWVVVIEGLQHRLLEGHVMQVGMSGYRRLRYGKERKKSLTERAAKGHRVLRGYASL